MLKSKLPTAAVLSAFKLNFVYNPPLVTGFALFSVGVVSKVKISCLPFTVVVKSSIKSFNTLPCRACNACP